MPFAAEQDPAPDIGRDLGTRPHDDLSALSGFNPATAPLGPIVLDTAGPQLKHTVSRVHLHAHEEVVPNCPGRKSRVRWAELDGRRSAHEIDADREAFDEASRIAVRGRVVSDHQPRPERCGPLGALTINGCIEKSQGGTTPPEDSGADHRAIAQRQVGLTRHLDVPTEGGVRQCDHVRGMHHDGIRATLRHRQSIDGHQPRETYVEGNRPRGCAAGSSVAGCPSSRRS